MRLRLARRQFSLALAERARLSREIHDTLLQSLVGVALQLDAISSNLGPSSVHARTQLTRVRRQVESYIREARQSIWDLRSPVPEARDMVTALREFGKRAVHDTSIRFAATVTGIPYRCTPKIENQLLRIGQEAVTNAVRHASASRIHLDVAFEARSVTLRVTDDGRGFEISQSVVDPEHHYGLTTMRERAEDLDGQFRLVSAAGRGTTVEAVVPTLVAGRGNVTAEG
jgi:signal transduction histidine kinase